MLSEHSIFDNGAVSRKSTECEEAIKELKTGEKESKPKNDRARKFLAQAELCEKNMELEDALKNYRKAL